MFLGSVADLVVFRLSSHLFLRKENPTNIRWIR